MSSDSQPADGLAWLRDQALQQRHAAGCATAGNGDVNAHQLTPGRPHHDDDEQPADGRKPRPFFGEASPVEQGPPVNISLHVKTDDGEITEQVDRARRWRADVARCEPEPSSPPTGLPLSGLLAAWRAVESPRPSHRPALAALERWYGDGLALAWAWPHHHGVTVAAELVDDVAAAARLLADARVWRVAVGRSLTRDPAALHLLPGDVLPQRDSTAHTLDGLRRLLSRGLLRHDGGQASTSQLRAVLAARDTAEWSRRERVRCDALKASWWAAQVALDRREPPRVY